MSSNFGKNIKLSIFGESHGDAIGFTLDGIPAGEYIDMDRLFKFIRRRSPGNNKFTTKRREIDNPVFLSGFMDNITTGSPISCIIKNKDHKSKDYGDILDKFRPSHADFTGYYKYNNYNDKRGGGHFSGRLTAPITIIGGIIKQILEKKNIYIGAHILQIGELKDDNYDFLNLNKSDFNKTYNKDIPIINEIIEEKIKKLLENIKKQGNSIGGVVQCGVIGLPIGVGSPIFDGLENNISKAIFGIPGVKGIEFGSGFFGSSLTGLENNDNYEIVDEKISIKSNNAGGILGGISTGFPIVFNVAMKPTPSISIEQDTINIKKFENTKIKINGRHDPCIAIRSVPVVESMALISIYDMILDYYKG